MKVKNLLIAFAIVVVLLSIACAQNRSDTPTFDWKEVGSKDGRFKAVFPGIPREWMKSTDTPVGTLSNYRFEVALPKASFFVWYVDFPSGPTRNDEQLRANFDNLRDGIVKSTNSKVVGERDVLTNGTLGREIQLLSDSQVVKYRVYLKGSRQYQLITSFDISLRGKPEMEGAVDRFLNSFEFTQ